MTTNIKYGFVLMCLILSYGLCSFADDYERITISEAGVTIDRSPQSANIQAMEDAGPIEELLPLYENPYESFEPDYIFSESDEAILDKDIGNY